MVSSVSEKAKVLSNVCNLPNNDAINNNIIGQLQTALSVVNFVLKHSVTADAAITDS